MKKCGIYILTFVMVVLLVFSFGCDSDIPSSYPEITLPPADGQSTSIVIDDIIEVPPSELWHKTIEIPSAVHKVKLAGWSVASGGARNDVKVLFLNDIDFHNWRNFGKVKGLYQSEKATVANITAQIDAPGKYHLVFSNWFSEFSTKKVIAKVYLYWSIKPVSYELSVEGMARGGYEFQVPAGANVTMEFKDTLDIDSFKVKRIVNGNEEETPIFMKTTDLKVWFIAPPYHEDNDNLYYFGSGKIEGKFSIIPPEPAIGRGFTVSSSLSNAPPSLKKIPYNNEDPFAAFTIEAIDPDDDELTYYAFNLPMAVSGYNEEGRRIWRPAATLDENTGELIWNASSGNITPGKYFVRFEAFDGILRDQQDITMEIK